MPSCSVPGTPPWEPTYPRKTESLGISVTTRARTRPVPAGSSMGGEAMGITTIQDPNGEVARRTARPVRPAGSSRDVPLGHALLVLVVATLGVLLVVTGRSPAPGEAALATPAAVEPVPRAAPADRVASVADALLLRAAFSVVPELREAAPAEPAGPRASLTAGQFGASALRPSGLLLPTQTSSARSVGVSGVLWAAYGQAARRVPSSCHLEPSLLAAIGEVESGSLVGRHLDADHNVVPPVLGPRLTGAGVAAIRDTDDGRWDGDRTWDRAVGPMQFIPGTWRVWGSDGNGDGVADPQNVEDAVYSSARYLCAGGRDLSRAADLRRAILSYNHSLSYLARILELMGLVEPSSLPDLPTLATPAPRSPAATASTPFSAPPASASLPSTATAPPGPPATTGSATPAPTSTTPAPTSTGPGSGTAPPTSTGTATSAAAPDSSSSP